MPLWGEVDPTALKTHLDQLAKVGLPIKITEFDMNTTDEAGKAKGLETFYRTCFAHPAVDGIIMWGLFWRARTGFRRRRSGKTDWSPTPAALVYHQLVYDEWWTRYEGNADARGICEVPAFFGKYRVEVDGQAREVTLAKAAKTLTIDAKAARAEQWTMMAGQAGKP